MSANGQSMDSVKNDLAQLSNEAFYHKYCLIPESGYDQAFLAIKRIWSLDHLRNLCSSCDSLTCTLTSIILESPSRNQSFFVIGIYRIASRDHFIKLGMYRVDPILNLVHFSRRKADWEYVE